ncbi:MAG: type III glutamate--ammonia ligase, partial [Pseudomonadota bacterium]
EIDMYAEGHKVRGAPRLPLNMLDAIRAFDKDKTLKAAMGDKFSAAFIKLKSEEWNRFTAHFTQWERDNTLDI